MGIIVPKSSPDVAWEAPSYARVPDYASTMRNEAAEVEAVGLGISALGSAVLDIEARRTVRKADSLLVDADTEMANWVLQEEENSQGIKADGHVDRVAEHFSEVGKTIGQNENSLVQRRFMATWENKAAGYIRRAGRFERESLDRAAKEAMEASGVLAFEKVYSGTNADVLVEEGNDQFTKNRVYAARTGSPPEMTELELRTLGTTLTEHYLNGRLHNSNAPEQVLELAAIYASNFQREIDNPPTFSNARPNELWSGYFPGSYPQVDTFDGKPGKSNVVLSTFDAVPPAYENGPEKVFVIPTMESGKLIKGDSDDPDEQKWAPLRLAQSRGLDNYPFFDTREEAQEWIEANHGRIDEDGGWSGFTPMITPEQYSELKKTLLPIVTERRNQSDADSIWNQSRGDKGVAYRLLQEQVPSARQKDVKTALDLHIEITTSQQEAQQRTHDTEIVSDIESAISRTHPSNPEAGHVHKAAMASASRIQDPETRKREMDRVNSHFAGESLANNFADYNLFLEQFSSARNVGDVKKLNELASLDLSGMGLGKEELEQLLQIQKAILDPDPLTANSRAAALKIIQEAGISLFGPKPEKRNIDTSNEQQRANFTKHALMAIEHEQKRGHLLQDQGKAGGNTRIQDIVNSMARQYSITPGDDPRRPDQVFFGETTEEFLGPEMIMELTRFETQSQTPTAGDVYDQLSRMYQATVDYAELYDNLPEEYEDPGVVPHGYIHWVYGRSQFAQDHMYPPRISEKGRSRIAAVLSKSMADLTIHDLNEYMSIVWSSKQLPAEIREKYGDFESPPPLWVADTLQNNLGVITEAGSWPEWTRAVPGVGPLLRHMNDAGQVR
jgi:hypothetical protein